MAKKATMPSQEELKWAVSTALREVKNPHARAYLEAIPLANTEFGSEGVRVNVMYALSNMGTWRGENARKAKVILKAYVGS